MKHSKKKTDIIPRRIAFSKMWRDERLCFAFNGVTREEVREALQGMGNLYGECRVTVERTNCIRNGRCPQTIVATISEPHLDMLSEKEWPMVIERFLEKLIFCQVTYLDDIEKLLNT